MDIFGPPSPPPAPYSPEPHRPHPGHSPVALWPPVDELPQLVDAAVNGVRLYKYPIPKHLEDALDLQLKHVDCRRIRAKHPWIDLEDHLWQLMPDAVWVDEPSNATFFVVPHAFLGHQCANSPSKTRNYIRNGLVPFFEYIYYAQPYFNRSNGRDHVTIWIYENGPLCDCVFRQVMKNETIAFKAIMNTVKVGYWAHRDTSMFGWRPGVDIAMPQFGAIAPNSVSPTSWEQVVAAPKFSYGFSGTYWGTRVTCPATERNASEDSLMSQHHCECSPNTRTWLRTHMASQCNTTTNPNNRCSGLSSRMGSFWYALCPAAWACWSSRLFHAIDQLAVPAIMANGAIEPFEGILDWRSFAIRIDTLRLTAGNASQLDWLHHDATVTARHCSGCATCDKCIKQPLVRRVKQLQQVRQWFSYNASAVPYNAIGLFLLELHCRQWYLQRGGDGTCRRHHHTHEQRGSRRHPVHDEGYVATTV